MDAAELKKAVEKFDDEVGGNCCLHITIEDDNIEDSHIDFCLSLAKKSGHKDCLAMATMLRDAGKSVRAEAFDVARCAGCGWYTPKKDDYCCECRRIKRTKEQR